MAELLTAMAADKATDVALIDEFGETMWGELEERVNRLINGLRNAGLQRGDTIAIVSENRREYYEVMLAATHCGLRYVPVNWHRVAEELS